MKLTNGMVRVAGIAPADLVMDDGKVMSSDRTRYVVMGMSVCVTAVFSAAALPTALSLAAGGFSLAFLGFGLLWGLFVFNLDRWVVSSVDYRITGLSGGRLVRFLRRVALLLLRVIIALLIGLAIAEPVLMLIFHVEIAAEIEDSKEERARLAAEEVQADPRFRPATYEEDERFERAKSDVVAATQAVTTAQDALDAEEGGSGGTRQAGSGRRTRERRADLQRANTALAQANSAFDEAKAAYDRKLDEVSGLKAEAMRQRIQDINHEPGLIDREEALAAIAADNPPIRNTQLVVRGLILLIDVAPLLLKIFTLRTIYDLRMELRSGFLVEASQRDLKDRHRTADQQRSLRTASELFAMEQQHRIADETAARDADLALRRIIADHARQLDQAGLRDLEDADLLQIPQRNGHRRMPTTGEPQPATTTMDRPSAGDPNEITFDGVPRKNVVGKPGDGLAQHVADRWRLGQPISQPGPAEAWRTAYIAEDILDMSVPKKYFVVKRVHPPYGGDMSSALNELHSLPAGEEISPYVAPLVQGSYDPHFGLYVVAPYYKAGTLQDFVSDPDRHLTLGTVLVYLAQVLEGLLTVFENRLVVHYDIKPSNIALDETHVRIIDWGLAHGEHLTTSAPVGYSLWYAPPEQVNARPGSSMWRSPRCDIRAVGATLYCLVTGAPPLFLEAQAAGLLDDQGHLLRDREDEFKRLLAVTRPVTLDAFFAINGGWDRTNLQPLSDLVSRWLDPDPARRVVTSDPRAFPHTVALDELRAVTARLVSTRSPALSQDVGRQHLPKTPLVQLEDLSKPGTRDAVDRPQRTEQTVVRPAPGGTIDRPEGVIS